MNKRLTDRRIEALKPLSAGEKRSRRLLMDGEVPGFGVRVTENGKKSYVLVKRYPGFEHPAARVLGACGALTLEEAREKARAWIQLIARGIDPADREREDKLAAARRRVNSFAAVLEDFTKEKLAMERRGHDVDLALRREFLPAWAERPLADITVEDVLAVVRAVKQRGHRAAARNMFCHINRFFGWAIDQYAYGIKVNPCNGIKPARIIGERRSRDRVLSDDELFALWRAAARLPYPVGPVYRMLILTGLRLNEVADAKWSEFDFRNGMWVIPASRMKGRDSHAREFVVPLTADLLALLETLPRFKGGDFVFSNRDGRLPVWLGNRVKKAVDVRVLRTLKALARRRGDLAVPVLMHWVNHDIRRTVRSGLSKLRIDRDVREMVLAHKLSGIAGVYDRHDYFAEKKNALERWAAHLREFAEPPAAETNVVLLPRRL